MSTKEPDTALLPDHLDDAAGLSQDIDQYFATASIRGKYRRIRIGAMRWPAVRF